MALGNIVEALQIGKVPVENTAIFMCDLQEKFRPAMLHFVEVIANAKKLVESTKILGIPLIVTEQYPQGLGGTVSEINIEHAAGKVAKTKFSMIVPEVEKMIKTVCDGQLKCAVLFGVEAHVCVEQTAMDLISSGIKVHIVADATTSRSQEDRLLALERLKQMGCFITTSENVIYKLLGDKNHPKFNEIRPFIKDTTLETGLVSKMNEPAAASKLTWQFKLELAHTMLVKLSTSGRLSLPPTTVFNLVKELIKLKGDSAVNCDGMESRTKSSTTRTQAIENNEESSTTKILNRDKNCSLCGKSFTRPQDLRRHLRCHDETSRFLCESCGKSFKSPDGLSYHKALNHPLEEGFEPPPPLSCSECRKCFANQIQLKVHLKNSHQRAKSVYTCTNCVPPSTFERKDVFKNHSALHEGAKPFSCHICDKNFSSRSNLQSHARTHEASSSLQCPTCSKKFNSKKKLKLHVPECLSRIFCPSCKFFCQREEDLTEHTKKSHPADYAMQAVFGQTLEELS